MTQQAGEEFHETECIQDCPLMKKAVIQVPVQMFYTWVALAQRFDTEWIAYLTGKDATVDGMYFPDQKVSVASCETMEGSMKPETIGKVHSHASMGCFFSATDSANMGRGMEIVINRKGEYKAKIAQPLECGRLGFADAEIELIGLGDLDAMAEKLEDAILEVIEETQPEWWADPKTGTVHHRLAEDFTEVIESMTAEQSIL